MTCTPFRSSIVSPEAAVRSRTYAFRGRAHGRGCIAAPMHSSGSYGPPTYPRRVCGLALTDVLARVEAAAGEALEILKEYVRFPTISAHKRAPAGRVACVRRVV